MARRRTSRIYWRERGGARRAYGDFRDYADVGGKQEPLIPEGQSHATTDPDAAQVLVVARLKVLEAARRTGAVTGHRGAAATLGDFAREHLQAKERAAKVTDRWNAETARRLDAALAFFGAGRELRSVQVADVRAWLERLAVTPTTRGRPPAGGTLRHYLNDLSNLYRRAIAEGKVPPGFNPAASLIDKPAPARAEARWLEIPAVVGLLDAAQAHQARRPDLAIPFLVPLLATFVLTGGRKAEVLGLEVEDVSFDRKTITFRPNRWRRLKTATSFRSVPLWPQLEAVLRPYVFDLDRPPSTLLFPRFVGEGEKRREQMLADFRKPLDALCRRLGWSAGAVTPKMFRHTYCAARLQTLDRGAPVSPYTVGRELGHGGDAMVRRVYGHLGTIRARGEVVEYRPDPSIVTVNVTTTPAPTPEAR